VLKVPLVRAVAEGLLGAEAAAADADALAAAEAVWLAFGVYEFKVFALHTERAIGEYGKFGRHVLEGKWLIFNPKRVSHNEINIVAPGAKNAITGS
jgi:hypothetical protein